MKIAVIGAGAIGCTVAGYLRKSGADVTLVGRPEQVRAIKKNGLKINGVRGNDTIKVNATEHLEGGIDLAIFTVKTQDIDSSVSANKDHLNDTMILSTQNGVQADNFLNAYFAEEDICSSIVMFGATYIHPGEATFLFEGDWIIGKPFGKNDAKVGEIADQLRKSFSVVITDDIVGMKWLKLFVNFNNCLPALLGKSMQETFADIDLCRLSVMLAREGVDIVNKAGIRMASLPNFPVERITGLVKLPMEQASAIINKSLTTLSNEPIYGSILQSIKRGRASEIDYINGEVVRLAKESHWAAPLNEKIVDLVHGVEKSKKYLKSEDLKHIFQLSGTSTKAELT